MSCSIDSRNDPSPKCEVVYGINFTSGISCPTQGWRIRPVVKGRGYPSQACSREQDRGLLQSDRVPPPPQTGYAVGGAPLAFMRKCVFHLSTTLMEILYNLKRNQGTILKELTLHHCKSIVSSSSKI